MSKCPFLRFLWLDIWPYPIVLFNLESIPYLKGGDKNWYTAVASCELSRDNLILNFSSNSHYIWCFELNISQGTRPHGNSSNFQGRVDHSKCISIHDISMQMDECPALPMSAYIHKSYKLSFIMSLPLHHERNSWIFSFKGVLLISSKIIFWPYPYFCDLPCFFYDFYPVKFYTWLHEE